MKCVFILNFVLGLVLLSNQIYSANRTIDNDLVSISVVPSTSVSAYAVEEQLANGLQPGEISGNGLWDATNRKIKWGPFIDSQSRTFSYAVTGTGSVSGVVSYDGVSEGIVGDALIDNPEGNDPVEPTFDLSGWTWNDRYPFVYSQNDGWLYFFPSNDGIWIYRYETGKWILKK